MARTKIDTIVNDLVSDSGSILCSFIKGEQLEYPVALNFISDVTVAGYVFEAVVVEAANVVGQLAKPEAIRTGGIQTTLGVRLPNLRGTWASATAYNAEDVVLYNSLYYKRISGNGVVNATAPNVSPSWAETSLNIVHIQFPLSLASTWQQAPTVQSPVYGFLELRVTEPTNSIYTRTWKPVRGMVEIHFSPTDIVP
jgi:hypothetical protein